MLIAAPRVDLGAASRVQRAVWVNSVDWTEPSDVPIPATVLR